MASAARLAIQVLLQRHPPFTEPEAGQSPEGAVDLRSDRQQLPVGELPQALPGRPRRADASGEVVFDLVQGIPELVVVGGAELTNPGKGNAGADRELERLLRTEPAS